MPLSSQSAPSHKASKHSAPAPKEDVHDPFDLVQASLFQAQQACEAKDWSQVIRQCEVAIGHCRQHSQAPSAKPPKLSQVHSTSSLHDLAELHQVKGALFERKGQIAKAIQAYQEAIDHAPELDGLQIKLGDLYRHQDEKEAAISHYQTAVSLNSQSIAGHAKLAALLVQQQRWHEGITHYEQALSLGGENLAPTAKTEMQLGLSQSFLEVGKQLKGQGKPDAAARAYLKAVEHQPNLFEAYNRLRYNLLRYEIGNDAPVLAEIITVCQKITGEFPNLVPAHIVLGYALTKQGKREAAIDCYRDISDRTAQRLHPQSDLWENAERRSPDYIILGAEKSGTSSLYCYLNRHPAILSPIEKEIDFFDLEYEQGVDWYLSHFPSMPQADGWRLGETSANYLYSEAAPKRILKHFPKVKLIVLLRNPIERTVSRFNMMVRNGTEKRSFEVAIQQEIQAIKKATRGDDIHWKALNVNRHLGNSLYYYHLKRWLNHFPREQFLILPSQTMFEQPEATLKQLYHHLGLEHSPEQDYPQYNAGTYEPIAPELRQTLAEFLAPPTRQLESLLNCSFNWSL